VFMCVKGVWRQDGENGGRPKFDLNEIQYVEGLRLRCGYKVLVLPHASPTLLIVLKKLPRQPAIGSVFCNEQANMGGGAGAASSRSCWWVIHASPLSLSL